MDALGTISDRNYASKSLAMLAAASNTMPNLDYFFLDIEGCNPTYSRTNFHVLTVKDIGLSHSEIQFLQNRYNLIEFATAVKPIMLEFLL